MVIGMAHGLSHQSDDEHVNEGEITWLSTNDDEKANEDDDEYDDDRSIDIEETNDERSDEDQTKEEQANDDQAQEDQTEDDIVGTLVTMSQNENLEVPPSSSSRSMSLNYGNQFLNISSDTSLVGIINDHAYTKINSLLDVQIQQEIPFILSAPLLDVLVLMIPSQTTITPTLTPLTTPLPTPPIISEAPPVTTIHDPLPVVIQQLDDLESKIEAWTKVDHSEAIEASVQANVINEVKNQLPKVIKDLVESRMESTV
ncbi:hypothetical protein Tco_0064924 [Tanacetum coccineum]